MEVQPLSLRFEEAEQGELRIPLRLTLQKTTSFTAASWELWLDGRWFAAGTQALSVEAKRGEGTEVVLVCPLAFRRLPASPDVRPVEVGVRGILEEKQSGRGDSFSFRSRQTLRIPHVPQVDTED